MSFIDLIYNFNQSILQSFWGWWALLLLGVLLCFMLLSYLIIGRKHRKLRGNRWEQQLKPLQQKKENKNKSEFNSFEDGYWLQRLHEKSRIGIGWRGFQVILLIGGILSFLLGIFVMGVLIGIVFTIVFVALVLGFLATKSIDSKKKLVEQLPMFLQAMSHTLQAGYSLQSSFAFVADEMDEPLRSSLQEINRKLSLQVSLEEVLIGFAQSVQHPEINFFTESTIIQVKTGGNLVQLFQKIAFLIEEKLKLQRDIKSFTSQGKMSGLLIAALWPGSLVVFNWISPSHVGVLFHTTLGNVLLSTSIILELIGFFLIWRIVQVKL